MEKSKSQSKSDPNPELVALGERIRELRVSCGYSSAEKFALDHGLSRVHYGRWESGKSNITYTNLLMLARAFDVNVSKLLEGQ